MANIQVQKVTPKGSELSRRELYATVCYFYPQYTLKQVQKLPYRDVSLLVKVAKRQEAIKNYNLTQIAAAPHTKNGSGVKTLMERFKELSK